MKPKEESKEPSVAKAISEFAGQRGIARLDGQYQAEQWTLTWRVALEGQKVRRIIRTSSFDRYAGTVAWAIAARMAATSRKPPAIAPAAPEREIKGNYIT